MEAGAGEADEGAEFGGGPLGGGGGAVDAGGVGGAFLEGEELGGGWGLVGSWSYEREDRSGRIPCSWFRGRLPTYWRCPLGWMN